MIFVKRLETRVKHDVRRDRVRVVRSLFSIEEVDVVLHVVERVEPTLLCIEKENLIKLGIGDKISFRKPLYLFKSCGGEVLATVIQRGNAIEVHTTRILCKAKATERGFCPMHLSSEYRAYLSYVFGVSKHLPTSLGIARVPHMLYAMHVGGGEVKVGIANSMKNVARLYEQAFIHATILAFLADCVQARELEQLLSSLRGVTDRITARERVRKLLRIHSPEEELGLYVSKLLDIIIPRMCKKIACREKPLPVISFSSSIIDNLRRVHRIVLNEHSMNSLDEGVYEIFDYLPGGIGFVSLSNGTKIYIPYQLLRNAALNASIVR